MAAFDRICVEIIDAKGSTPRNIGAKLWVSHNHVKGSIGGGRLEAEAIAHARKLISAQISQDESKTTLGPDSGQCCGGVVTLRFFASEMPRETRAPLIVFGAGHIGGHIARLARALDADVHVFDDRALIEVEAPIDYEPIAIPERVINDLPKGAVVLILTHDHGLDFLLAQAALGRDDFAYIGMIGSKSKAARFRHQFPDLDHQRLHSPIAKSSDDKRPVSVALAILSEIWEYL